MIAGGQATLTRLTMVYKQVTGHKRVDVSVFASRSKKLKRTLEVRLSMWLVPKKNISDVSTIRKFLLDPENLAERGVS